MVFSRDEFAKSVVHSGLLSADEVQGIWKGIVPDTNITLAWAADSRLATGDASGKVYFVRVAKLHAPATPK